MSNPAEVAKTRLQLQGELAKDGGVKVYKNALDVFSKTIRNEGIRGMQRGLGPAVRVSIDLLGDVADNISSMHTKYVVLVRLAKYR